MNPAFNFPGRRQFLNQFGMGLGGIALADMPLIRARAASAVDHGVLGQPHFAPKAKRIIYLFMSGGPSQLDLFDYKPLLNKRNGEKLPDSVRSGQRLGQENANLPSFVTRTGIITATCRVLCPAYAAKPISPRPR